MILLATPSGMGINPFFPIFVSKNRKEIQVVDWGQYKKLVPFFVAANSIIALCFVFLLMNVGNGSEFETYYSDVNFLLFLYIGGRLIFGRRLIMLKPSEGIKMTVAPSIVWLDYISIGAMFVFVGNLGMLRAEPYSFMKFVFIFIEGFFAFYSFVPLLNYLKYRSNLSES